MFFYRVYRYSNLATFFSLAMRLISICILFGAMASFYMIKDSVLFIIPALLCLAAAGYFFYFLSIKKADKIAENDFAKKIYTNARLACMYCNDHPELFQEIASKNPAFAAGYAPNVKGKIVKIKR